MQKRSPWEAVSEAEATKMFAASLETASTESAARNDVCLGFKCNGRLFVRELSTKSDRPPSISGI
jgi:hypothetical protein